MADNVFITFEDRGCDEATGLNYNKVPPEAASLITEWLESQGKKPEDTIRGYTPESDGSFVFAFGGGYDVRDKDILGGNGDGTTRPKFEQMKSCNLPPQHECRWQV